MKLNIDPIMSKRINDAWTALTADQKTKLAPLIARAGHHALLAAQTRQAPPMPADIPRQALLISSALNGDQDSTLANLSPGLFIDVGPNGEIWGTGKYEELDPGWAEAAAVWLEYFLKPKAHFIPGPPAVIPIPSHLTIAIAGDWGTGDWRTKANPAPSTDVKRHMAFLQPDLTIHLGDTYYAGTPEQEKYLLADLWPEGKLGALSLNSNHEMYSGAEGYFGTVLANEKFKFQNGSSFFALQNDDWVIIGLDTAYYAKEENLYLDGALFRPGGAQDQVTFVRNLLGNLNNRKVIILSHHEGLSLDGSSHTALWDQVMAPFGPGAPYCWYWGHSHAAAVYSMQASPNTLCRCCGHGAIPWGFAKVLDKNPKVDWFEARLAKDPEIPHRVLNGFAMLSLDGPNLKETFYDENGGVAWSLG